VRFPVRNLVAGALVASTFFAAGAAQAGQAEIDRLANYVGDWRGTGLLVGGDEPETFTCRLSVSKGNALKINYAGRCALLNRNLSVSGTIAYNDQAQQYEAAMSSNAKFTGQAVGRVRGENVVFDLRKQDRDQSGNDIEVGAVIILEGPAITVDFEVEFNDSGDVLTASVPFAQ
jgi:hypothetical protein